MLQDVDLKYINGVLTGTKPLAVPSLTVGGTAIGGPGGAQPSDHGMVAWTFDPASTSTSVLVNGTLYLSTVFVRQAATATKAWWINSAAAITPTTGQNFIGLYNISGTLLTSAAIDSTVSVNGPQSATLGTSQALTVGRYWVGLLVNAATPPTVARQAGASSGGNNINLAAASYRFAINGTGLTSMPSSFTPSSNALSTAAVWVGLS